jgi:hypothetical protein
MAAMTASALYSTVTPATGEISVAKAAGSSGRVR